MNTNEAVRKRMKHLARQAIANCKTVEAAERLMASQLDEDCIEWCKLHAVRWFIQNLRAEVSSDERRAIKQNPCRVTPIQLAATRRRELTIFETWLVLNKPLGDATVGDLTRAADEAERSAAGCLANAAIYRAIADKLHTGQRVRDVLTITQINKIINAHSKAGEAA